MNAPAKSEREVMKEAVEEALKIYPDLARECVEAMDRYETLRSRVYALVGLMRAYDIEPPAIDRINLPPKA